MLAVDIRRKAFATARGEHIVIERLGFSLGSREIVALVGPSGCGKSTLLRIIGGLDLAYDGRVLWSGATPRIGTVFQQPLLLPWRTVRENIALVLPPGGTPSIDTLLDRLGLRNFADAYPQSLSLGMARRVAIARAFAIEPDLLLLDEPFVSLDPTLAEQARALLQGRERVAALVVTHDLVEAAGMAHRILLLSADPMRVEREITVPETVRQGGLVAARAFVDK